MMYDNMRNVVTISLPPDLLRELDAASVGRSRSEVVREALAAWLEARRARLPTRQLGTLAGTLEVTGDLTVGTGEAWEAES